LGRPCSARFEFYLELIELLAESHDDVRIPLTRDSLYFLEGNDPNNTRETLDPRERATLHRIIGALAHEAKLDLSEPFKAGEVVAKMLPDGASVKARTIGEHLKAVRETMDGRKA
jgi:hypothetical protein